MPTSDEYRAFARKCYKWAEQSSSDEDRAGFLLLAKHWMQAAWFSGNRLPNFTARAGPSPNDTSACDTPQSPSSGRCAGSSGVGG